ncbi:MAG: diadenylate cyclase CdaA [Candidatus Hinthialibacter antarcticus]|nr:diadenylate cyclase CdaA [Candidatus Hinthialibacter antarcticus]
MKIFGVDPTRAMTEIVILWLIFYLVLKAIRGTRAFHVFQFLVFLFLGTYLSKLLDLYTVHWFLSTAQAPIFVGLIILYAPELRRSMSKLTQTRFFRKSRRTFDPIMVEAAQAAQTLSRRHIGCLVVFERSTSLQGFVDTGISLDSLVSSELLVSIFSPLTPLHDGAVIVREGRIAAAACLLPLSEREEIDSSLGTRHRAALGLAEETDAVTLIVSEETGAISLAINGRITRDIDADKIESILTNVVNKGAQ